MLARGGTQESAGRAAKCSTRTVHRRLQDPVFRKTVRRSCYVRMAEGAGLAANYYRIAIETLVALTDDAPDSIRLRAGYRTHPPHRPHSG